MILWGISDVETSMLSMYRVFVWLREDAVIVVCSQAWSAYTMASTKESAGCALRHFLAPVYYLKNQDIGETWRKYSTFQSGRCLLISRLKRTLGLPASATNSLYSFVPLSFHGFSIPEASETASDPVAAHCEFAAVSRRDEQQAKSCAFILVLDWS